MSLGLYLHIPYCFSKCRYCDFYSHPGERGVPDAYVDALLRELHRFAPNAPLRPDTVYFGGGTPSLLTPAQAERLIRAAEPVPGAEITLEANPETVTEESLRGFRAAGVNRISLGAQTADPQQLRCLHRIHSTRQVVQAVADIRRAKITNLSLDLIYGLPDQDMASWLDTLSKAIALAPEHLSCYGLKVEEGTPLARQAELGLELPDGDDQADFYLAAVDRLRQAGYHQYEISNFSKPGKESRHNLKYWMGREYVGFGPGAHSYFDGQRYAYPRDLAGYLAAGGLVAPVDVQPIPPTERAREYLLLRMRTRWGIEEWEYRRNFGLNFEPIARKLEFFERHQWIVQTDHRWHFTPQGYLLSNTLILDLLDAQSGTFQEQKYWKALLGKPDDPKKS